MCAYYPERLDPGSKVYIIGNTPKVVGGIDYQSTRLAELLYSQVTDVIVSVSGAEVAGMCRTSQCHCYSGVCTLVCQMTRISTMQ